MLHTYSFMTETATDGIFKSHIKQHSLTWNNVVSNTVYTVHRFITQTCPVVVLFFNCVCNLRHGIVTQLNNFMWNRLPAQTATCKCV